MQRSDEALAQIGHALELDPLSLVVNCHKGWIFYFARRHEDAIEQLQKTIEMDEDFLLAEYFLGLVYMRTAQYTEASNQFAKAREDGKDHPATVAGLAAALALCGKKSKANELLNGLEAIAKRQYVDPYYFVMPQLALGNEERAFNWLEKAYEERSVYMSNLKADPALDSLRSGNRFTRLLRRVGLPHDAGSVSAP